MLAGIIYFRQISDLKVYGIQTRNFGVFRGLRGDARTEEYRYCDENVK